MSCMKTINVGYPVLCMLSLESCLWIGTSQGIHIISMENNRGISTATNLSGCILFFFHNLPLPLSPHHTLSTFTRDNIIAPAQHPNPASEVFSVNTNNSEVIEIVFSHTNKAIWDILLTKYGYIWTACDDYTISVWR